MLKCKCLNVCLNVSTWRECFICVVRVCVFLIGFFLPYTLNTTYEPRDQRFVLIVGPCDIGTHVDLCEDQDPDYFHYWLFFGMEIRSCIPFAELAMDLK